MNSTSYTGNSLAGVVGLIRVLRPLWSTYDECCNCPPLDCWNEEPTWGTQFDNWIGVLDTGEWFEDPPNTDDEEEIMELLPIVFDTSEKNGIIRID